MTYILAIAREGGIAKAAGKLFITQSALDQQLLKLEQELGTRLFYRSRSKCYLTPAGEVYVDYAKRMVDMRNEAYHMIHDIAGQRHGTLTLAFAPERGMDMFMDVYPEFYEKYPSVNIIPRELSVRHQLELLRNNELELGFVSVKEPCLPGLTCTELLKEEFVLICSPLHPLAKMAAPKGRPLAVLPACYLKYLKYCFIYKESTQREIIDPLFKSNDLEPDIFLETASNRANISMVQKNLSCSIVPYHYAKNTPGIVCFRLEGDLVWSVAACCRQSKYLSEAAHYFIKLARRYFAGNAEYIYH